MFSPAAPFTMQHRHVREIIKRPEFKALAYSTGWSYQMGYTSRPPGYDRIFVYVPEANIAALRAFLVREYPGTEWCFHGTDRYAHGPFEVLR